MAQERTPSGRPDHGKRALLIALMLTSVTGLSNPRPVLGQSDVLGPSRDLAAVIPEFNRLCSDLVRAREELQAGLLDDQTFADRILSLFIDADSLSHAVATRESPGQRVGTPDFALDRGFRYLIASLRENYVGIVARDGGSFVDADRLLMAAMAWRSGLGGGSGTVAVVDAIRP